ncbi:YARHG domain-containing protein [Fusobacterium nucleatum]|uniref:YARHG domain-containing protein n=1 Tax=Fusobacterium nucleatum TaxID=851 RepID=UPI0030D0B809
MKDNLDNLEDVNENIEEDNTEKNNDEKVSVETEIKGEVKETKKQNKSQIYKKDNFQTFKIILVVFLSIMWLALGYFIYSKLFKISREKIANEMMSEFVNTSQVSQEETNSLAALEEPITEASQELIEEEPIAQEDNISQITDDNYDLVVLDKVYDEVINRGNEAYLNNFSSDELAIIRNTLYAKNGYKFKKKEYQKYFGEKSWYNPTTSSQNILTRNEEKLANIIKRYE